MKKGKTDSIARKIKAAKIGNGYTYTRNKYKAAVAAGEVK